MVLTVVEAESIAGTREALSGAEKRLWDTAYGADALRAARVGKLTEAMNAAEEALFNVLNVAASYLDCPQATAAIRGYFARLEQRLAPVAAVKEPT